MLLCRYAKNHSQTVRLHTVNQALKVKDTEDKGEKNGWIQKGSMLAGIMGCLRRIEYKRWWEDQTIYRLNSFISTNIADLEIPFWTFSSVILGQQFLKTCDCLDYAAVLRATSCKVRGVWCKACPLIPGRGIFSVENHLITFFWKYFFWKYFT